MPEREFILPFNTKTESFVHDVYNLTRAPVWSLLFDASGGRGISPKGWEAPVFPDIFQGYSGGISHENICDNLDTISKVVGDRFIWVDAEGALMVPNTRRLDMGHRVYHYLSRASEWNR